MTHLIAYNQDALDALLMRDKAETWYKKGGISAESWQKIKAHFITQFHTPNPFMRLAGLIFCSILILAFLAILMLFSGNSGNSFEYLALFMGVICIAFLEFMIQANHYKSGIDDALLYWGLAFIIGSLAAIFKLEVDNLSFYLLGLPILIVAAIRYIDGVVTIAIYGFLVAIIYIILVRYLNIAAPTIVNSILMLFSAIIYFCTIQAQKDESLRFWSDNLNIIEGLSLILFYICGNYYCASGSGYKFPQYDTANPIFWITTILIPFFYIYQGLKRKDRLLLSIGLLAIAAAVATFRYYFHVVPMELTAIIGGAILLSTAYFSIQYLKQHKTPFSYDEEDGEKPFYHQAESLIIAQSLGNQMPQEGEKPLFGGGEFGGGGAGQEF